MTTDWTGHRMEAFIEDVTFLREAGLSDQTIARRLGVHVDTLKKRMDRHANDGSTAA